MLMDNTGVEHVRRHEAVRRALTGARLRLTGTARFMSYKGMYIYG